MPKYNIIKKENKDAIYRLQVRAELADELYEKILRKLIVEKKYKDPDYSAKQLAIELETNTRYISAVINSRFQQNYSSLVNEYRIREALFLLADHRYINKRVEQIGTMVGFANRQSFYSAFFRVKGMTPKEYREQQIEKAQKK